MTDAALDLGTLRDALDQQWAVLSDAFDAGSDPRIAQIQSLQRQILMRLDGRSEMDWRLIDALERLESMPCRTEDIVAAVPELVCHLGFDRAIISSVSDGLWQSEAVHVPDEPDWAAAIHTAGRDNPQMLGPHLHETEVVRRREGMLVVDAQSDGRVNKAIADASLSRSYVAAPLVSEGRVVGLLHADKYRQHGDVTVDDCRLLMAFSHGVRIAMGRARLAEQIEETQTTMRMLCDGLGTDARRTEFRRRATTMAVNVVADDLTPHVAPSATRVGRANLTAREHEVLALIARGLGNGAIAAELVIAEGTVKQHVKHVLRKLQANNRSEATAMYFQERSAHA